MIYSKNDIPKRFGNAHMPVILAFGSVRHGTKRVKALKEPQEREFVQTMIQIALKVDTKPDNSVPNIDF